MSITLHVDPETERLARRLAETTGLTVPAVVKSALEAMATPRDLLSADRSTDFAFNQDLELDYLDDGPAQ